MHAESAPRTHRVAAYVAPAVIIIAAFLLRFYQLDHSSLWSDEGNTWALIQRSWSRIATDAAADIHPPGYYWLLKFWTRFFGTSAAGMRSLSATVGTALVYVTYQIALLLWPARSIALLAASIVAISPFQIFYSQEARMYMLLALQAAGFYWALLVYMDHERRDNTSRTASVWLLLLGTAGLWTHYSFPIILAGAVVAYLFHLRRLSTTVSAPSASSPETAPAHAGTSIQRRLMRYAAVNLVIVLLFTPWLPIAFKQVFTWPQGGNVLPSGEALRLIVHTLTLGPLLTSSEVSSIWLWLMGFASLVGLLSLPATRHRVALASWLLGPILLMFAFGLFSDAFLKFLLVAAPAWSLAIAASALQLDRARRGSHAGAVQHSQAAQLQTKQLFQRARIVLSAIGSLAVLVLVVLSWQVLPGYYRNATARDNYAGIARYVAAIGDPKTDLVILDAPGQLDVWRYYDPGLPVLPLPAQRPPNRAAVSRQLVEETNQRGRIFALFWAEDEADPEHIVENWLNQRSFKSVDSWQGNVRFVVYTFPNQLVCDELVPPPTFGTHLRLEAQCMLTSNDTTIAGEVAPVGLHWRALEPITARLKVSVQLLDSRNQLIAQHDAEPAGGSRPTTGWQVGERIVDNHGLSIPFGTPPGAYRLLVAVYAAESGERLLPATGEAYSLGLLTVARPPSQLPLDVLPIQYRLNTQLGPVQLAGYNVHRQGYAHAPETPLEPGAIAHLTFFWLAPTPLPATWDDDIHFTLTWGDTSLTSSLAGPGYPTGSWQAGDLVRGEFDVPVPSTSSRALLSIDETEMALHLMPTSP